MSGAVKTKETSGANTEGTWKKLFYILFNNKESDENLPNMWAQFKKGRLHKSDIRKAIEDITDLNKEVKKKIFDGNELENKVIESLWNLSLRETAEETCFVSSMRECSILDDNFWRLLFTHIRDKEVEGISEEKTIPILEGGLTRQMSMEDIECKFISENSEILTTQRCVPDQVIHEDLIDAQFNTGSIRESLRRTYNQKYQESKKLLVQNNPKMLEQEAEKQAAAQAKQETKESREAKQLQHRVAMVAEETVQKSILRAMKEFGIPGCVFRGVNTFDDIGKFLENFGIKISKLKSFKCSDSKATLECEHDIVIVALLPTGPWVSFVQVTHSNNPACALRALGLLLADGTPTVGGGKTF